MLTTVERNRQDELIMGHMFRLEMLCHKIGEHASTQQKIDEIEECYPLNAHANSVLCIRPQFVKPIQDDIPTDPDEAREASDLDEDEIEEE